MFASERLTALSVSRNVIEETSLICLLLVIYMFDLELNRITAATRPRDQEKTMFRCVSIFFNRILLCLMIIHSHTRPPVQARTNSSDTTPCAVMLTRLLPRGHLLTLQYQS
jgi:hypothetical protein